MPQEKRKQDVTLAFDDLSSDGLGRTAVRLARKVTAVVDNNMTT